MKYLISPSDYPLPNNRVDGFRKLKEVNAKTVDISVFALESFDYFLKNKELPAEFVKELSEKTEDIIKTALTHEAVVRRAFVVPGMDNPPGPRFLGLPTPESVIDSVKELYGFAIKQGYNKDPKSQISGFLYPFIDPEKYDKESPNISAIPYGGYAIFESNKVEIFAVFGNNEGVQSLVADRYVVDIRGKNRFLITKREVPQKNKMFCTTKDSGNELILVPTELQFEQVLVDNEILEIARVASELSEKYGPQRVEFTADTSGIVFNEVADYWKEEKQELEKSIKVTGVVKVIDDVNDFEKLRVIPSGDLTSGKVIIKIGEEIIANRNYDTLGTLASWKDNLYVLYPGIAATQHAMRVLTDKGHKAFLVGNQKFEEGDEAQIIVTGGKVRVTNLSRTQSQKYVSLWDANLLGVELCGGKADSLSRLKILGYQVPHGAVLTTLLFDEVMKELGFDAPISVERFPEVYNVLEKPSIAIIELVEKALTDYIKSGKVFSVRSSATIEDDSKNSMAGMFETYLNVSKSDLAIKAVEVIRSTFSPKIENYLKDNPRLTAKLKMAVVVQEMVNAKCAGVIFGANTQTKNLDIVEVEANKGLGEGIVSGEAKEVEQYKFSRNERRVVEQKGPKILSSAEVKALFMLSERLRAEFGDAPQDIEWAIDEENQIWVLQSRDLNLG